MTLTFQDDRASLTLSGGPSPLDFDLSKVPGPEATSRLRALTLGLAERLCSLERQLAGKRGWRWGGWRWGGWGGLTSSLRSPYPRLHFCFPPAAEEETSTSPRKSPWQVGSQHFLPGKACYQDLDWGSVSPEQGSASRGRIYVCGPRIPLDSGAPPSCFPQTWILREVALDLGSRDGAQESLSSTPASRGAPPPLPPVPRV